MKSPVTDSRPTEHLFGELSDNDAAALAVLLATDPALASEQMELEATLCLLIEAPGVEVPTQLSTDRRQAILAAAAPAAVRKGPWWPVIVPLAAAAAVVIAGTWLKMPQAPSSDRVAHAPPAAASVAQTPAAQPAVSEAATEMMADKAQSVSLPGAAVADTAIEHLEEGGALRVAALPAVAPSAAGGAMPAAASGAPMVSAARAMAVADDAVGIRPKPAIVPAPVAPPALPAPAEAAAALSAGAVEGVPQRTAKMLGKRSFNRDEAVTVAGALPDAEFPKTAAAGPAVMPTAAQLNALVVRLKNGAIVPIREAVQIGGSNLVLVALPTQELSRYPRIVPLWQQDVADTGISYLLLTPQDAAEIQP